MEASTDRRLVAGRYVLGGPLGRGGMGTVWRADDVLLGRPVAVKEVELPGGPPGADREAASGRALREARAAARLNHPGAVTLHDVVEADGRLYLVMELVDAPTLRELVERSGPLAPAAAARVGLELLAALEAAHRAGIVHHDVKPANVMVTADGRVKLADFGIASLQDDTQRTLGMAGAGGGAGDRTTTAAFGSLPYVAPEQAGDRRAGPAADLWALGATLWFAVEGAPPFQRPSPAATLAAILHDPPGRPWRAGPLEPVLLALLAKDPAQRPSAAALRRLLEPLAGTARLPVASAPTEVLAGPAPPPGWGVPRPPGSRRRRGRVRLPGWSAPPPRRRRGRRLLVAVGVLALVAVAANLGQADRGERGPAGLGDPVRDGQFEFVVRSVACGARSVGQGLAARRALAQFCLVELRVENTGTEGRTFGGGGQYLFDDAGNRHDPDLDATVRHGDGRLLSTHLNPGQRLEGTLVYDVPDPVDLARVELHDGPFSGGASVALG
jgi:eukaryotic-like serine/threonine-protein kinase